MDDLFGSPFDYDFDGGAPPPIEFGKAADAPPPPPEFNEDEALPNKASDVVRVDKGVQTTLKTLSGHLQNLRSPDGSRAHPAKTCQDIKQCYPLKRSGV